VSRGVDAAVRHVLCCLVLDVCIVCCARSDVQVVVDFLVPRVNSSNGVFIAARVDQGGCTTFLARGVFFFLLFNRDLLIGHSQAVIATDLGKCCLHTYIYQLN